MRKNNSDERLVESYTSKDQGLIARYLGVKKYKMKNMHKAFPSYKKALFYKAVSETIKAGYEERVAFDLDWGEVVTASFQYLEVGRNNSEELMTSGFRLVVKDSEVPLAVNVFQHPYTGELILSVSYNNKHGDEALEFFSDVLNYVTDNNFYIGEKIDLSGKFLTLNDMDFEEVVLPEDSKKAIKLGALDFFKKKDIYVKNKLPYKRGLIFTGVPGTGKTLTGKILMNSCESTFLWVSAGDLNKDSYTPASKIAKSLFNMARELTPCILFIEDVDDFLEKEGAVDSLKTQMDGMDSLDGIVTILCTNFPDKLPLALIDRPSRFDDVIVFNLPDEDLRFKILNKVSEPMNVENRNNILKDLSEKTEGLTGSHLKEIIVYALLLSADEGGELITEEHLAKALIKVLDTKQTITDKLSEINVKCLIDEIKIEKGE